MAVKSDSTFPESSQSQNVASPHTPEPWAYDEDDARIYHADGDVQPTIAYVERDGVAPEQVKADGYLLAAAPHQNAALIDILDLIQYSTDRDGRVSFSANAVQVRILRDAIAKATG